MQTKELIHYLKNKKNNKIGVVIAKVVEDDKGNKAIGIGWSRVHAHKDRFNKEFGLKIARGRCVVNRGSMAIPVDICHLIDIVAERSERYFKGLKVFNV